MPDTTPHTVRRHGDDQTVRILTFNSFLGRRLDVVSRLIRQVKPDLAFIQEVLIHRYRGWTWNQAESIGREFGMAHAFQRLVWRGGVEIGLALLSTGEIRDTAPIKGLPQRPTGLSCRVDLNGRTISAATVHFISVPRPLILGYPYVMRMHNRQMRWTLDRLEELGGPAVMVGDLNTIPGTPAHRTACRHMTDVGRQANDSTGTRRTFGIPLRIDYVFASSHFGCQEYRVLPREGSDHSPVLATLDWKNEPEADAPTPSSTTESASTA